MMLLNALRATSVRILTPWTGVWFAEVDFDLGEAKTAPTGACTLTVGTSVLVGTIDPRSSGIFGESGKARVVGGGGGWDKPVTPQHFKNDAGVLSTLVLQATAAQVGEKVTEVAPTRLGPDYVRVAGPASRVLEGLAWYVNAQGVTVVGPRAPVAIPSTTDILTFDPSNQTAILAGDDLVVPGTVLTDTRFGTKTVRDVEQTFDDKGARTTAWCGDAAPSTSRLISALRGMAKAAIRPEFLKAYKYRVVAPGADERPTLQAVDKAAGVPDSIAISPWFGLPGIGAKLKPGTEVLVEFIAGDPKSPVVRSFQKGGPPLELELDALLITIGLGTSPIALAVATISALTVLQTELTAVAAWAALVTAAMTKLAGSGAPAFEPVTVPPGPFAAAATAGGVVATALGTVATNALAAAIADLPSKKVVSE